MEFAKFTLSQPSMQRLHARMILKEMPDHENSRVRFGEPHQLVRFAQVKAKRLLDIDILAVLKRRLCKAIMHGGWRSDGDGTDFRAAECLLKAARDINAGSNFGCGRPARLGWIADQREAAEFVEITNQVLAPVAAAQNGDSCFHATIAVLG